MCRSIYGSLLLPQHAGRVTNRGKDFPLFDLWRKSMNTILENNRAENEGRRAAAYAAYGNVNKAGGASDGSVSYTHLTLPTIGG